VRNLVLTKNPVSGVPWDWFVADGLLVCDGVGWRQGVLRNRVFAKNPVSGL
jgi:hypothetical protein